MGVALIYLLMGALIFLFSHSAFISYLKGTGVKVSEKQFPELYAQYQECCRKLDKEEEPELYILNSDGILNALATRFLRRHYVVLYSSIVDALKKYPNSINFYIGHELGHVKRGHLNWATLTWPGKLLPLVGAAYSRAREYTCDFHGLHCCKETKDAAFGMAVLATGPDSWSKLNIQEYMKQSDETGGFWMSFNEFTADYPWLCKRMKRIVDVSKKQDSEFPRRSIFAGILAFFIPRIGVGGPAGGLVSVMVVVAIIGILAAVALPAYQDYTVRARVMGVEMIGRQIKDKASPYLAEHGELPFNVQIIGLPLDLSNAVVESVEVGDEGFILKLTGESLLEGKTVIYKPSFDNNQRLQWSCNSGTLETKYLPVSCR